MGTRGVAVPHREAVSEARLEMEYARVTGWGSPLLARQTRPPAKCIFQRSHDILLSSSLSRCFERLASDSSLACLAFSPGRQRRTILHLLVMTETPTMIVDRKVTPHLILLPTPIGLTMAYPRHLILIQISGITHCLMPPQSVSSSWNQARATSHSIAVFRSQALMIVLPSKLFLTSGGPPIGHIVYPAKVRICGLRQT